MVLEAVIANIVHSHSLNLCIVFLITHCITHSCNHLSQFLLLHLHPLQQLAILTFAIVN